VPFVFALLVLVALGVLLWKLRDSSPTRPPRPVRGKPLPPRRPIRSVAPDDDPDFLRELSRKMRRHRDESEG
jgi:hypothetical protein